MTMQVATQRPTIKLPDGFNGDQCHVYIDKVLEVDGDLLKMQVADEGKEYMSKWVRRDQLPFETVTETVPSNGNKITYFGTLKIIGGTAYHIGTPKDVVEWLETSRERKQRIRIFLGDTETGRDGMNEFDTFGHVGRSAGEIKIPLLIKTSNSIGGTAISDDCIVRIMTQDSSGKYVDVYKHPLYHQPTFMKVPNPYPDKPEFVEAVFMEGKNHAAFKKAGQADRWIQFMKGERASK